MGALPSLGLTLISERRPKLRRWLLSACAWAAACSSFCIPAELNDVKQRPTLKHSCHWSTIAKHHAVLCGASVRFCCMPGDLGRLHAIRYQSERVREVA